MTNTLQEMTKEMQVRIRELAYLMWESAGRQHGMAMEYWLKAESEVMSTLQAAASRMMPGNPAPSETKAAGEIVMATEPEPAIATQGTASPVPTPAPAPAPEQPNVAAEAAAPTEVAAAGKPAPRKPATRAKKV